MQPTAKNAAADLIVRFIKALIGKKSQGECKVSTELKYYIYVSKTKIEMLFSQIPKKIINTLTKELTIKLGVVSASAKQKSNEDDLYKKLQIVDKYIKNHKKVGTIDKPSEYFYDKQIVRWGPYEYNSNIVYFAGSTDETCFGLGGSFHHVIGSMGRCYMTSHSHTPFLIKYLYNEFGMSETKNNESYNLNDRDRTDQVAVAIAKASQRSFGPEQRVEFLAKKLLYYKSDWPPGTNSLLGTPIYVALIE